MDFIGKFHIGGIATTSAAATAATRAAMAVILKYSATRMVHGSTRVIVETRRKTIFRADIDQLVFRSNLIPAINDIIILQRDPSYGVQATTVTQDGGVDMGATLHIHDRPIRQTYTTITVQPDATRHVHLREIGERAIEPETSPDIKLAHINDIGVRIEIHIPVAPIRRPFESDFTTIHEVDSMVKVALYSHLSALIHIQFTAGIVSTTR